MHTQNEQSKKNPTVDSTSGTQQANMQNNTRDNSKQRRIAVNNEQKDNINDMPP